MRRLPTTIFSLAAMFGLTTISVFAQNVTYLDENYRPATSANYTYKRVIKYKEPFVNWRLGTDIYGGTTVNPQPVSVYICSLTDYYKTGELALIGNQLSSDINCSHLGGLNGQVISYYRNGNIKLKTPWKFGKPEGTVIEYSEDGTEKERAEYVNGKLIEEGKFAVSADNPLVGTWKYVEYSNGGYVTGGGIKIPPSVRRTSTFTYSQNGVVDSIHQVGVTTSKAKGNWKYTPTTASSGVLEELLGDDLVERANVKFLSRNQLEYTITFSQNSDLVGHQSVWTRQ